MSREAAYARMLDASAKLQWNVAMILEAKATEAEKVRNWLLTHMTKDTYTVHSDQLSTSLQFHEHNVDLIDGLTKLCNGLNRNMKAILEPEEEESGGSMASLLNGFGSDEEDS